MEENENTEPFSELYERKEEKNVAKQEEAAPERVSEAPEDTSAAHTERAPEQIFVKQLRNHTVVTAEVSVRATRRTVFVVRCICIICFLLAAIFMLIGSITDYQSGEMDGFFAGIVLCAIMIALALWIWFGFARSVRKSTEKLTGGQVETIDYTFTDEGVVGTSNFGVGADFKFRVAYYRFLNVEEYDDMWVFTLIKTAKYVALKSGMTEGTAEELSQLLKSKLGPRYKVRGKKK